MIKKMKEQILALGLNPKKELIILLSVNILALLSCIVLYIFLKQITYCLFIVGFVFIFNILFLTRYSKQIEKKNVANLQEFAALFGYFRIYIHNGFSVYSALKELTNFANHDLKLMLETLLKEIDEDKSVQPFINFARNFNEIVVEEMMISIYQLIDDGETSEYLMQFELIFDKFSDLLYQKNLRSKDSKLGTLGSAPLIGSCFLIIVLTIGIISIIGDLLSGI